MKTYFNQDGIKSIKPRLILLALVLIVFVNILFQLIAAPIKSYHHWKGEEEVCRTTKETDSLTRLLTFKQALATASSTDSIYMVISVPDTLVSIYVKGVPIFNTKIISYSKSTFLSLVNTQIYSRQFAIPQKGILESSTIVKEPIKIKIAPKNAEEAALMATIPDSVTYEPAFISYKIQNGILIKLVPENQAWLAFKSNIADRISGWSKMLGAMVRLKIYDQTPEVSVTIDNNDLTSIYRALPHEPFIVVRF